MSERALFITEQGLKEYSLIDENLSMDKIRPTILVAQDMYLQPILGTDLYNLKLSKNAKFQLIFLTVPSYKDSPTAYTDYNIIRLRTATECKVWDSYKKSFGYPIIYKNSTSVSPETYVPNMETYISINPNFFNAGYIEFELEYPNEGSADIDFTNARNNPFYIHFKIIDVEDEQTQDLNLAPLLKNDDIINFGHNKGNHIPMLRD
jgi:hypothetical protein